MSVIEISNSSGRWRTDTDLGADIAIPLDFHGSQPVHFHADPAGARPMQAGAFTGDTRAGGSCNAEVLTLNPHCNGTHTECVGHLTRERLSPAQVAGSLYIARLISVRPEAAAGSDDSADPPPEKADRLITRANLAGPLEPHPVGQITALIVRTLPNSDDKRRRVYTDSSRVPYFSSEAIRFVVGRGIDHLLVDTPSIDRMDDGGRLGAHRMFWGLPAGSRALDEAARPRATITEMIHAPDTLPDGLYLLDLQIAPFLSDAAPSRPLLFPLEPA